MGSVTRLSFQSEASSRSGRTTGSNVSLPNGLSGRLARLTPLCCKSGNRLSASRRVNLGFPFFIGLSAERRFHERLIRIIRKWEAEARRRECGRVDIFFRALRSFFPPLQYLNYKPVFCSGNG